MGGTTRKVSGVVGALRTDDYVYFDVEKPTSVTLELRPNTSNPTLELLDAGGVVLASGQAATSFGVTEASAVVYATLGSGRYYVHVLANSTNRAGTFYDLTLKAGAVPVGLASAPDSGGNSMAGAAALGYLTGTPVTIADYVGPSDLNDYYSFAVNARSTVTVALAGLQAGLTVDVLDASGMVLATRAGSAVNPVVLNDVLPALASGTYFLHVYGTQSSAASGYNLSVSASVIPDGAGETFATARALGTLSSTAVTVSDNIGRADEDYYSFSVSGLSTVAFTLSGAAQAYVYLYDSNQQLLTSAFGDSEFPGKFTYVLDAPSSGTYYARVSLGPPVPVQSGYSLTASAVALPNPQALTQQTAVPISVSSTPASRSGFVGAAEPKTYYSFVLAAGATINLRLQAGTANVFGPAQVLLLDTSGSVVSTASATTTGDGLLTYGVATTGTYYAVVQTAGMNEAYTLTTSTGVPAVGSAGVDNAGNSLAAARAIGALGSATKAYSDYVSPGDTDDYYSFTTSQAGAVRVALTGLIGPLTATLLDSTGATLQTASVAAMGSLATLSLDRSVAAGSYYLDVRSSGTTGYNLALTGTSTVNLAGLTEATAYGLGTLGAAVQTLTGFVSGTSLANYYKFTLDSAKIVNVALGGVADEANIQLEQSTGASIVDNYAYPNKDGLISHWLPAGSYLVYIFDSSFKDNDYTLTVNATPVTDPAGPTLAAATSVGALGQPLLNDFGGDGNGDLLWRNGDGTIVEWSMAGATVLGSGVTGALSADWKLLGTGDLDGNGTSDLMWRQSSTGQVVAWQMSGSTVTSGQVVGTLDGSWTALGLTDVNGDGKADVIWRNNAGLIVEWQMNGSSVAGGAQIATLGLDWSLLGTGDFNNDGHGDLLWRNVNTGAIVQWDLNGSSIVQSGTVGALDTSWTFLAAADFNGDGVSDMLWRNTAGTIVEWLMNSNQVVGNAVLGTLDPAQWESLGAADLNGDGKSDILWRNAAGTIVDWTMDGLTVKSGQVVTSLDAGWKHLG